MNRNPKPTWRQRTHLAALVVGMTVGIIFGIWGKNPFDPNNLWGKYPQIVPFLWISVTAFIVAVVLSYTIWPLVRAETTRKNIPVGKEPPFPWYDNGNIIRVNWLAYIVVIPGICVTQIFRDLAAISHLEIFSWLSDGVFLVAMVTDIAAVVLIIKGFRKRAKQKKRMREQEQQSSE